MIGRRVLYYFQTARIKVPLFLYVVRASLCLGTFLLLAYRVVNNHPDFRTKLSSDTTPGSHLVHTIIPLTAMGMLQVKPLTAVSVSDCA